MSEICIPASFPSYSQIRAQISGLINQASLDNLSLPTMPTMPSFAWPSLQSPYVALEMFAQQLQAFQVLAVMNSAFQVLSTVTRLSLPRLGAIDLSALLALRPELLLSGNFPNLLPQSFPTVEWPENLQLQNLQLAAGDYMRIFSEFLFGFANQVADILVVSKLGRLPVVPSPQLIFDLVKRNFPGSIRIPGFSVDLSFPNPLIPNIDFAEFEMAQMVKVIMTSLPMANLQRIVKFIDDVLPGLSVPIPRICVPVSV